MQEFGVEEQLELDLLFKLKVNKDGFWVALGTLATRTVCFLSHSFLVLPHSSDVLGTKLSWKLCSEYLQGVKHGSYDVAVYFYLLLLFSTLLLNLLDLSVSFCAGYKSTISCSP